MDNADAKKGIIKMIGLLDRCKCEKCQQHKKKWEERLNGYVAEDNYKPPEKEDCMQGVNEVEYWRAKAHDYQWLYQGQKEIAQGYKEIIEELQQQLKRLNIEKAMRNQKVAKI